MQLFILQGDTIKLIYSYHSEDPVDNEQFSQHQFQGSMTINLFGQPETAPTLPDGVQYFDITNDKVCTHVRLLYMRMYRVAHCLMLNV